METFEQQTTREASAIVNLAIDAGVLGVWGTNGRREDTANLLAHPHDDLRQAINFLNNAIQTMNMNPTPFSTGERQQSQESDRSLRKASATLNKLLPPWRRLRLKLLGKFVVRGDSGLIWKLEKGSRIIHVHFQRETFGETYVPECQSNTAADCPWEDWAANIYLHIKSGIKGEAEVIRTSGIGKGASFFHIPKEIVAKLIPAPSLVSMWGRMRRRRKELFAGVRLECA